MGSRRKRKAQRSTDGADRVASHARHIDQGPPLASSASMATSSSNTQPPTPISSGTHSALTDTGKHPRVVPVTKQSDDGTYELVYETVDDTVPAELDFPDEPPPVWRRRSVQIGALVAVLVVVLGGIGAAIALSGGDEGPKKVRKASKSAVANGDKDDTPYEYVAPSKHEGRIDDLDDDPKKAAAKPKVRNTPIRKPPMPTPAAVGNAQPEEPVAENPGAIEPPLIDGSDFKRQPRLDLKGPITSPLGIGLKKPLDPRTRALLGSKLTDPTGAPIDDEEEEEGDDEDEEEGDDDEDEEDLDEEEGDDDEEDEEEGDEEEDEEGDDEEDEEGDGEEEEEFEE